MTETPNTLLASRSDSKVLSPTLSIRNHRINYSLDWLHVNTENPTSLSLFDASFAIFALKGLQSASTCVISVSDDAGDAAPASGKPTKGVGHDGAHHRNPKTT
jgi:hypothetical protein